MGVSMYNFILIL